jgi:hypothetical protein
MTMMCGFAVVFASCYNESPMMPLSNWNVSVVLQCMLIALNSQIVNAYSASPVQLSEELGCSPTLAQVFGKETVYFDPLGFATDTHFARLREAELKHGRVAMVAVMGLYAPKIPDQGLLEACKSTKLLSSIQEVSVGQYVQILLVCGILETLILVQRNPEDLPGDDGTGYFGVRNKGGNERSLVSELENGRLAMLSMLILLVQEFFITPDETFPEVIRRLLGL